MKTYRFNTWLNDGAVKLELQDGQSFTWHHSERTDEGWASETVTYSREGDTVYKVFESDGVDCDGRLSSTSRCFVNIFAPKILVDLDGGFERPDWQKFESYQRDYSAEAAGY